MTDQFLPVPFHDDTLVLVDHDGEPFVAMKPVVVNMGLDWKGQHEKLTAKFGSTMGEIPMVAEDGKQRGMTCLPLRKLPAWLYSVNPNKVAPELRDKIVRYQEECDEVLWNHWTQGHARNPHAAAPTIAQQMAVHKMRLALLDRLERETHPEKREAIHQQLAHASQLLGLPTPNKDRIGHAQNPEPSNADKLHAWIAHRCREKNTLAVSKRDLMTYGPNPLRRKAALDAALAELEAAGRVQLDKANGTTVVRLRERLNEGGTPR